MKCPACGHLLDKPRSVPQHRRYFAMIKAMFGHWPEAHEFQPDNPEHLRAWLQIKAGYREVHELDVDLDDVKAIAAAATIATVAMRQAGTYGFLRIHKGRLVLFLPRSIAFDKLSHKAFCALEIDIADIIKAETGLDPDQVLKETEAAA